MNPTVTILDVFAYFILVYSLMQLSLMLFIAIYSIGETSKYDRENRDTDFKLLISSPEMPGVSILAPAYNEGLNIIENVRSLLSIHYGKFEVIVINDGSLDN